MSLPVFTANGTQRVSAGYFLPPGKFKYFGRRNTQSATCRSRMSALPFAARVSPELTGPTGLVETAPLAPLSRCRSPVWARSTSAFLQEWKTVRIGGLHGLRWLCSNGCSSSSPNGILGLRRATPLRRVLSLLRDKVFSFLKPIALLLWLSFLSPLSLACVGREGRLADGRVGLPAWCSAQSVSVSRHP